LLSAEHARGWTDPDTRRADRRRLVYGHLALPAVRLPRDRFEPVRIDVTRNDNESVSIDLYVAGRQIVSATDEGSGA
jgi:hypothetical protein